MEKFSNWRDKGTGISPFLPVDPPVTALKRYVVNPALLAVKWPLFLVLYCIASVAPKTATNVIFKWLFSVADIDLSVEGVRKSHVKEISARRPKFGEVIVSNLVSPLDVFVVFLISKVTSLSSIVVVVPWKNDLYAFSAWQSISVFFGPLEHSLAKGKKIDEETYTTLKDKLVVVFAEGTPSNNRAILPLHPTCSSLFSALSVPVKVVVLRYYPGTLSLPVPNISRSGYVSKLLTLSKAFVKVKLVPLEKPSMKACQTAFVENGLNQVELGVQEKAEFFKYFQDYAVVGKK